MWKLFANILVFSFAVTTVRTLKCYTCLGSHSFDYCTRPDVREISLIKCDIAALQQTRDLAQYVDHAYLRQFNIDNSETELGRVPMACMKLVTRVGGKDYYLRGCTLAEAGPRDICNKVKSTNNPLTQTISCDKCSYEGCNSSSKFEANLFMALIIIAKIIYGNFIM